MSDEKEEIEKEYKEIMEKNFRATGKDSDRIDELIKRWNELID